MGRLENFKQRGRNRATKKRNLFVVIACEGNNKTEEVYFKNFNSRIGRINVSIEFRKFK